MTTKIHAACDGLENPLGFLLSPGNRHDSLYAIPLLEKSTATVLLADKAYGGQALQSFADQRAMTVLIPSKTNSQAPKAIDLHVYKERHLIENLFQYLKVFRRVDSRYDKLDVHFMSFVLLAGIFKWLQ